MPDRYPGYDVLAKYSSPSWNRQTRQVIDKRLAISPEPRYLSKEEFATLSAICDRIVPQPSHRPPIPVAAFVDQKLLEDKADGYRNAKLPRLREAWRRALKAFDTEAQQAYGAPFRDLTGERQDDVLKGAHEGKLDSEAWQDMPCEVFFSDRLLRDIAYAYYAHPTAWNEIGFGGPASPRGYVRMGFNRRDPWEAAEARPGEEEGAYRKNRRVG